MIIKILMLVVFFGVMVGIGLYCRRNATDVNGFVLGGRSVGPPMALLTSPRSSSSATRASSAGNTASPRRGSASATR